MSAERLDVFAPILSKSLDPESGVLMVEGKITGPDLDQDHQRMSAEFLSRAVPAWYRIGNIREQHRADSAVGKAVELWDTPDGSWHIRAKIVDKAAAAKVQHGVYTGFSIGISRPRIVKSSDAPMGLITDGDIVETSICDRASLPTARLAVCKSLNGQPLDDVDQVEEIGDEASDLAKAETVEEVLAAVDFLAKTTAPTVVANPDDPDAADPEALEKAKKAGKKAPPFTSDDKPKADGDSGDDTDGSDDEDDGKKPATKAAEVDYAAGKALLYKAFAERYRWTPGQVDALSVEHLAALTDPELNAQMVAAVRHAPDVVKTAEPDLAKGVGVDDEMDDIARAKRILADLACLVQSEAAGFLGGGGSGEVADMDMLVSVMATLTCFVERETYELEAAAMAETTAASGDITPVPTVMQLAATPDVEKAAEPVEPAAPSLSDELSRRLEKAMKAARKTARKKAATAAAAKAATVETPAPVAASTTDTETLTKAVADKVTADLTAQLGDVFTKAMGPVIDRVAEVETLLKSTPRPGGPVVTRVQPQVSPAQLAKSAEADMRKSALRAMLTGPAVSPDLRAEINRQIEQLDAA